MKIVLFGEDLFTAATLQSLIGNGQEIAAVICPLYPGNKEYQALEKAARHNHIPFLHEPDVNAPGIGDLLSKINPDLLLSVHLKKILRPAIFTRAKKGALNVHPSLLPKYRGLSPQHQALLHGDTETGVTIHFIDETADTGDILLRERIPLTMATYIYDLQLKMLSVYKDLVPRAITTIEAGNFRTERQEGTAASWFGALKDRDREIDLKKTKFETYNKIRAVSKPYKGAYHDNITVWRAEMADPATERDLVKEYGDTGIYIGRDGLVIRLQDGILLSDDFERTGM
ncbi:MAG TPA: methionyl-tRNA formyltransferase [Puia sp.]|jgi:UDP-4-amino-4-deoxy-L-arabinose formyltransferase/UDP-glucuronic acid dehydrogenase (UDP-4-keto-hexauronic acid decarboxylating)